MLKAIVMENMCTFFMTRNETSHETSKVGYKLAGEWIDGCV